MWTWVPDPGGASQLEAGAPGGQAREAETGPGKRRRVSGRRWTSGAGCGQAEAAGLGG